MVNRGLKSLALGQVAALGHLYRELKLRENCPGRGHNVRAEVFGPPAQPGGELGDGAIRRSHAAARA